jgi:hypothetical protein
MFQAVSSPIIRSTKLHTASGIVKPILLLVTLVDEMELRFISSMRVAGSSIGSTIPDAVCTVLCS